MNQNSEDDFDPFVGSLNSAGTAIYDFKGGDDFDKLITGRRIVSATDTTLTLDDGTVLEVEDEEDCCAWYAGRITDVDPGDSIITGSERVTGLPVSEQYAAEHFMIRILSRDKAIASIDVEGDPTSGWYMHSVTLQVHRKGDKSDQQTI